MNQQESILKNIKETKQTWQESINQYLHIYECLDDAGKKFVRAELMDCAKLADALHRSEKEKQK